MKLIYWFLILIFILLALFLGFGRKSATEVQQPTANLLTAENVASGFERATGPKEWSFPADFGPHPDYQTEWWYITLVTWRVRTENTLVTS